jgi:hypothetical protein
LRDVERTVLNGMREELKDARLIEAYARNYNEERQRLAASSTSTRAKLEANRTWIESERQRNIDMVIKQINGEPFRRFQFALVRCWRKPAVSSNSPSGEFASNWSIEALAPPRYSPSEGPSQLKPTSAAVWQSPVVIVSIGLTPLNGERVMAL